MTLLFLAASLLAAIGYGAAGSVYKTGSKIPPPASGGFLQIFVSISLILITNIRLDPANHTLHSGQPYKTNVGV
jgi:hypothetical protein